MISGIRLLARELRDFTRLFSDANRRLRTLVFFSERDIYYRYFEGFIEQLLARSDLEICYLTADPADPIFQHPSSRLKAFYLSTLLPTALRHLDGAALVMTMPDLGLFHVRRSRNPLNHVYVFHGVGSIHLQYRPGAFDHYDTLLCVGPRDREELLRWEEVHNTRRKVLLPCGYPFIERIHAEHAALPPRGERGRRPRVLVAPSWHPENILAWCLEEFVNGFAGGPFDVVLRPHPETFRREPGLIAAVERRIRRHSNFTLERNLLPGTSLHEADVLVTDWSAISFEYAFGTERPVLFVDTPCKCANPAWAELGLEPIEFIARNRLGRPVGKDELGGVEGIVRDLLERREDYRDRIVAFRKESIFNWGGSGAAGAEALIDICRRAGAGAAA